MKFYNALEQGRPRPGSLQLVLDPYPVRSFTSFARAYGPGAGRLQLLKPIFIFALLLALQLTAFSAGPILATDADGKVWNFNQPGRVLVVVGNNQATAQEARDCGKALDEFQGRPDFRAVVLVDLRGSLAHLAQGYAQRRMIADLDAEALRIKPAYLKNGNTDNPRPDIGAIPDFKGIACDKLGWSQRMKGLRVVIFGLDGREAARFTGLSGDYTVVRNKVFELLNPTPNLESQ